MSARLQSAYNALSSATDNYAVVMREEYPVGKALAWAKGGRRQIGHVVAHGWQDRLEVENAKTGKAVWILASDILRARALSSPEQSS